MAWLCRIDLLRERGRLAEALAWTCLECEINPKNVTAQALKEQLKRRLHLGSSNDFVYGEFLREKSHRLWAHREI